jgi:hypothetical protein
MNENENLEALEAEFHNEMLRLYEVAKKLGINATRFLGEIRKRGGVGAAKHFLETGDPWTPSQLEGVTQFILYGGKLEDTSESLVLKKKFVSLFEVYEREKACERLKVLDPSWLCED